MGILPNSQGFFKFSLKNELHTFVGNFYLNRHIVKLCYHGTRKRKIIVATLCDC